MRTMDGLEQRKEQMRDMRRLHWLTDFFDDARYALRSLHRTPGPTAFVVITLTLRRCQRGLLAVSGFINIYDEREFISA